MRPALLFIVLVWLVGAVLWAVGDAQKIEPAEVKTVRELPSSERKWVPVSQTTLPPTTTTLAPTTTTTQPRHVRVIASSTPSSARCGGDLPPCWVMQRESGGDPNAYNPTGCGGRGCRGKWQCDPRTCSGTGTEEQQDAEARALWDNGRGCQHWAAC